MLPQATSDLYRAQQRRIMAASLLLRRQWSQMSEDFDASWAEIGSRVFVIVASAQLGAARDGAESVALALTQQGQTVAPGARVVPEALRGIASDGRPLASLLEGSVFEAKHAVGTGRSVADSLAVGGRHLEMVAHTQIADAARDASSLAITSRPRVRWVRMVNPPCCQRCAVLAGRVFGYNQGFQRHPRCFPAGVTVSGPAAHGSTRRWYQGELVVIRTAGGKHLTATGNHPILTSQGWLPANLLAEGGDVVSRAAGDRSGALLVPNHDQMPARIEDLWSAAGMAPFGRVPVSPEDFHGDGLGSGHVDVVLANGLLRNGFQSAQLEHVGEELFTLGPEAALTLADLGAHDECLERILSTDVGGMGGSGLDAPFVGAHTARAKQAGLAWSANLNASLHQAATNDASAYAGTERDAVLALAALIGGDDFGFVQGQPLGPRWDAPADPFATENRVAYASRGQDLRHRLAGQVELDRLVEVRRVDFAGHVYNLTSAEGWYDANGIIVSNCDCIHLPQTVANPRAAGIHVGPDDVKDLTVLQRKAIADGADFNKVINDYQRKGAYHLPPTRVDEITKRAASRDAAVDALQRAGYLAA